MHDACSAFGTVSVVIMHEDVPSMLAIDVYWTRFGWKMLYSLLADIQKS